MFPVCIPDRRRRRKHGQVQDAGGTPALPGDAGSLSLRGESQKPSRQAKADAVGGGAGPPRRGIDIFFIFPVNHEARGSRRSLQMAACWIPWQGVNPVPGLWCKGCSRSASQTGGGGGSMDRFRMRAGRPRSQEMPDHSPFEENRRSRAERRRLMRWGVAPGRHAGESIFFSFSL